MNLRTFFVDRYLLVTSVSRVILSLCQSNVIFASRVLMRCFRVDHSLDRHHIERAQKTVTSL